MMRRKFKLVVFLFCSQMLFSQGFNFSGYLANFFIYQSLKEDFTKLFGVGENLFVDISRVRLRPEFDLGLDTKIYMEYEISALYFSSSTFFNQYDPTPKRQILKLKWWLKRGTNYNVYHFIDRLYIRKDFEIGNIAIGRQRISWGTGRVWNPTDLFNPVSPSNFAKFEKDGVDVVSLKFYLGSLSDLNFIYNPTNKLKEGNFGLRLKVNYKGFDISSVSGYFDRKIIVGFDFVGSIFNAGVRGEGAMFAKKNGTGSNFFKLSMGFDNQFTRNLYALFEYHFNGEGKSDKNEYEIQLLMNREVLNLSRNYLFMSIIYNVNPVLTISSSFNQNLNDGSGFINLNATLLTSDNSESMLGFIYFYGTKGSEYWYYSSSLFLKVQFYF